MKLPKLPVLTLGPLALVWRRCWHPAEAYRFGRQEALNDTMFERMALRLALESLRRDLDEANADRDSLQRLLAQERRRTEKVAARTYCKPL